MFLYPARTCALLVFAAWLGAHSTFAAPLPTSSDLQALDKANPAKPLPKSPLGITRQLADLPNAPTPETVRLGKWLFYDTRLSADNSISCATCHRPHHAFSEPTPVSTGIGGQKGGRKAPSFVNQAWTLYPNFFWDGRASSLEEQAVGPMTNPIEMGMSDHDLVINRLRETQAYRPFFQKAFGDDRITLDRVAKAIADYERTRLSGNSPWDRWRAEPDPEDVSLSDDFGDYGDEEPVKTFADGKHVSAEVKLGHDLFHGKAACNQCHLGENFTDSLFHNLGVGYDAESDTFADIGRYAISGKVSDMGAFKTPGLRDLGVRGPYMHDGSHETLREVVELYNQGGIANPVLSPRIQPLNLTEEEIDALVEFMEALSGEGYEDTPPTVFPE